MWLLGSEDLSLQRIPEKDLEIQEHATEPLRRYGILSHRWEEDSEEPTFEEYYAGQPSHDKIGRRKLEECGQIAKSHGLDLLWSDTCCIDKRSSAELQEAINSMYRYYENAAICFAYLRDVTFQSLNESFGKSEWFTRGWTLQELLAPNDLRFYDRNWKYLGDKTTLSQMVSAASGIDVSVLTGERQLRECSVAERMSWAAKRNTTRVEDRAYSLLGIFDVNMAMLYGEGPKAFLRLQEEIMKSLDDHSLFAWSGLQRGSPGLLAQSPEAFAASGDVRNIRDRKGRRPYIVNNRGVHGVVPLIPYTLDTYLTFLPCYHQDPTTPNALIGIFLRRLYEDDQYMRISVSGHEFMQDTEAWVASHGMKGMGLTRNISIRQSRFLPREIGHEYMDRIQGFRLSENLLRRDETSTRLFSISGIYDSESRIVSLPNGSRKIHHVGSINIGAQQLEIEIIRLGFDYDYRPVVYLAGKDVQYSEEEDAQGVFKEVFQGSQRDDDPLRLLPPGESFQNAAAAAGCGHWGMCRMLPSGEVLVYESANVNGFWAVRADRLDGLNVYLMKKSIRAHEKNYRCVGHVQLSRAIVEERLVWDLQLDRLAHAETHVQELSERPMGKKFVDDANLITSQVNAMGFQNRDWP